MELIGKNQHNIPDCPETPCINWPGPTTRGYGVSQRNDMEEMTGTRLVHRQIYLVRHGMESAKGLHVMHLCHNRLCFNVDHLHAGTSGANSQSGRSLPARAI